MKWRNLIDLVEAVEGYHRMEKTWTNDPPSELLAGALRSQVHRGRRVEPAVELTSLLMIECS